MCFINAFQNDSVNLCFTYLCPYDSTVKRLLFSQICLQVLILSGNFNNISGHLPIRMPLTKPRTQLSSIWETFKMRIFLCNVFVGVRYLI